MSSRRIKQELLDDNDSAGELSVRTYTLRTCAPPCLRYDDLSNPIGISILQNEDGGVDFFALSDGVSDVIAVSVADSITSQDVTYSMKNLFEKGSLVAFDMTRVAFHLRAKLEPLTHVRGVDLSRVASPDTITAKAPSNLVSGKVHHLQDTFPVDSLWNTVCGSTASTASRFETMCLRAWLSARYAAVCPGPVLVSLRYFRTALCCRDLVETAKRLDTRNLKKEASELLMLGIYVFLTFICSFSCCSNNTLESWT
jgi:hypothetical protein